MYSGKLILAALILLGTACRPSPSTPPPASALASLTVGKFEPGAGQSPWNSLTVKLEKVQPQGDSIEQKFPLSAFQDGKASEVNLKVPYGSYMIHMNYHNDATLVYQACETPVRKIDTPQYKEEIRICEAKSTKPAGTVTVETDKESDVTITPTSPGGKEPPVVTPNPTQPGNGSSELGKRLLIGYWHNFENGSGFVKLSDVSPPGNGRKPKWDIIDVAFAEAKDASMVMDFVPYGYASADEFKADVKKVQGWGQKVIISIGGEKGKVVLDTEAKTNNFISSMDKIIRDYGFDGLDIDFEGHSLYLNADDRDINNPTTPVLVNLIKAVTTLRERFGSKFLVTMAPETFFVQVGFNNYGALGNGDNRAGAYLPVIQKLNKLGYLTLLHVQNYNSGPIMGLDGSYRNMGTADFHVSMIEMVIQGFQIAHSTDPKLRFEGLKPEQLAIGVPSALYAGNGFTPHEEVQKAFTCLETGRGCGFPLKKAGGYPGLRGIMTWSINWDRFTDSSFSNSHRAFLDSL